MKLVVLLAKQIELFCYVLKLEIHITAMFIYKIENIYYSIHCYRENTYLGCLMLQFQLNTMYI